VQEDVLEYPIRGNKFAYSVQFKEHLLSQKTEFQQIDVYDTDCFGKLLTLDGHVQLSSLDEFAYHEALVHIPLLSLHDPKRALVVGGGDGGVLRELCRWQSLEQIEMVEIDKAVIEACRTTLPELSNGAFDDPRVTVHIADAIQFLAEVREPYDFIVMDITDAYEGEDDSLSQSLFTEKFHLDTKNALKETGFLVSQADNHVFCPYSLESLKQVMGKYFSQVTSYQALVPSFGGFSAYCLASKGAVVKQEWPGNNGLDLKYLNETTYQLALQALPF
jgi:spermidine synthase